MNPPEFIPHKLMEEKDVELFTKILTGIGKRYFEVNDFLEALIHFDKEQIPEVIYFYLKELDTSLATLTAAFEKAIAEKIRCQDELNRTNKTIELANRLVKALASENVRWVHCVAQYHEQEQTLCGDVLLTAAFISYTGSFSKRYCHELVENLWMPYLRSQKLELTKQQIYFKIELKFLEDELLTRLSETESNFLGDNLLVEKLETTKHTAAEIEMKVLEAKVNEVKINEAREHYHPAVARASLLYFIMNDLNKINPMYQFSLKAFNVVFHKAVHQAEPSDVRRRVNNLIHCITFSSFNYISRGLFERDTYLHSSVGFPVLQNIPLHHGGPHNLSERSLHLPGDSLTELALAPGFVVLSNLDYQGYHRYIDRMLPHESPVHYGLHPNAELEFLTITSDNLFHTLLELLPRGSVIGEGATQTVEEQVQYCNTESLSI
ncbi:Dynein beta chain, ciliary [Acipenser ruthenus]|uniref:Dynein beta chain, ciliary n=1 Tax=Acipenser ruthenus TaxID=7906 RepID=A0A444V1V6_ACIRT|nr:Dynein beta chain, ciliary [Acipenser ruthenus]